MRRLTLLLTSCVLPLAAVPLRAQQQALTLAEALALAEKNAPDVVQAMGNVRSAGAGVRAAWGTFLPTVSSSANYGSSFSDGPSRTDPITGEVISGSSSSRSLSLGGSAQIDLFTGFSRGANLSSSRANRTDAEAALAVAESQSALQTTNQFLLALQVADLVRVRNDAIRRAQGKLAIANAKLLTRAITIADSLQAMVDLTRAQLALLTEQRNLADAEANLARFVGMDGRVAAVADSSLFRLAAIGDTAALLAEAQDRSPAVVRAGAQVRAAKANVSVVRATYLPRVSLSAGTSFSGSDRSDFALFNGRSVNLGLSWPLFNGFARERDLVARQVALEAAESGRPTPSPGRSGPHIPTGRAVCRGAAGQAHRPEPGDRPRQRAGPDRALPARLDRYRRAQRRAGRPEQRGNRCRLGAVRLPARQGADRSDPGEDPVEKRL